MVILSHMRSLTSRPDSGEAMALATDAMSECSDKLKSSKPGEEAGGHVGEEREEPWISDGLTRGGGGGDGAEGGAAREGRVDAGHGDGVAHPRRRVDGPDRLVCTGGGEKRGPVNDVDRRVCVNVCVNVNVNRALTARQREVALGRRVPALGHRQDDGPGKQRRVRRTTGARFEELVRWRLRCEDESTTHPGLCTISLSTRTASSLLMFSKLDASVCSHSSALHDGADVDASVAPFVALAHDADAQEVVLLCRGEIPRELTLRTAKVRFVRLIRRRRERVRSSPTHVESDGDDVQGHGGVRHAAEGGGLRGMKNTQSPSELRTFRNMPRPGRPLHCLEKRGTSEQSGGTHPLQARRALFPASAVALEKPRGRALLRRAAEPARSKVNER
ncbi:hypothetical protein EYF80_042546 [Liparis tanakae]|uniref:Uncharacterized protein n=1 Tax=Liparis tanakae TaxID=230148 RepID=A0A4Z2G103_9TELE|nr:hypothetical protein EYF80_042546 [Liparis tanakae]